jgi:integrase
VFLEWIVKPFEALKIVKRTLYQTRHTFGTLMLAAGENPEWIARQMGHEDTTVLFTVYSRFVQNLTRPDGSAFVTIRETHGGGPSNRHACRDSQALSKATVATVVG